jgi:uncharacterized membrane protein YkvA (DUF1232 family)
MPAIIVAVSISLVVLWLVLIAALMIWRPQVGLREAATLLPDLLLMLGAISQDRSVGWSVRARIWLLLFYLAFPIDLVPDVIPIVGWADDAILVVWCIRSVIRRSGRETLERHWRGQPEGLELILSVVTRKPQPGQ